MSALKMLNLAVRFLLELCMYAAVGYWGFKTQNSWLMKIFLGIGLPVLIAVLWGTFLAPKATRPLSGASFLTLGTDPVFCRRVRPFCQRQTNPRLDLYNRFGGKQSLVDGMEAITFSNASRYRQTRRSYSVQSSR